MRELTVVLLSALLCACQLAPSHERPTPPIAQEFPGEYGGEPDSGRPAPTLGWRDFFADPHLEALIALALERNRDLAVAVARIEEARAAYRIQRADRLPTLSASASAMRSRTNAAALGAGDIPALGSRATTDIYTAAASISAFELDFWGRVRNLSAAARARYLSSITSARAFQLSLIRDVALAYLSSLEAAERIRLAHATLRSRAEEMRLAQQRFDAGVISELDLRQAETLLTQAEADLAGLRLTKAQSDNFLTVLIGGPTDADLPAPLPLGKQVDTTPLAAGLPSGLLASRPDVLAAETELLAARADIGAARAAFFPTIVLTSRYGYASTDLDELFGDDERTWSYGPALDLPIFDFGRRRANLDAAAARETVAIAQYERTVQTAFQEVADALAGRRHLAEQVDAQERNVVAQRRLSELARQRYLEGVVSYLEVLDAERNLFAAEQALLQLRSAQTANLVSLYVALGGGVLETG